MSLPDREPEFLLHVLRRGTRTHRGAGSPTCRCGADKLRGRWLCDPCYAAYRRDYRARWPDPPRTGEALLRARARSYANTYLHRGLIAKQPCAECGSDDAVMRHHDYAKPLEVHWTCKDCDREAIRLQRALG